MKYSVAWLKEQESKGIKEEYYPFWGGGFSNFQQTEITTTIFTGEVYTFNCSEQHFMYSKAVFFNDLDSAYAILEYEKDKSGKYVSKNKSGKPEQKPHFYKTLGRKVRNYHDGEWSKVRLKFMQEALLLKFTQNEHMKKTLLDTKDMIIIEASPFDNIWGIKRGVFDVNNNPIFEWKDVHQWRGENLLGFALMDLRDSLRNS